MIVREDQIPCNWNFLFSPLHLSGPVWGCYADCRVTLSLLSPINNVANLQRSHNKLGVRLLLSLTLQWLFAFSLFYWVCCLLARFSKVVSVNVSVRSTCKNIRHSCVSCVTCALFFRVTGSGEGMEWLLQCTHVCYLLSVNHECFAITPY